MEWRVIGLQINSAFRNMAIDEAILESMRYGRSKPTIRFYTWKPSAVSIGCFQSMRDEVNLAACRQLGIDFVRRITGGGAVYHDENGEITYSVIAPESILQKGIRDSYRQICGWVIDGLAAVGIKAEFAPINDITVNGKKISGNAQTRRHGIVLQHGTVIYKLNLPTMFSVLNVSKEKISDKMIKSAEDRVTSVLNHVNISREDLYAALLKGFTKNKDFEFAKLGEGEESRANGLAANYQSDQWNLSR
ncbi:MAG: biotin/lipoate A/B protein ligase family protein [Candidatus Micrarchaeaceae archaeon]